MLLGISLVGLTLTGCGSKEVSSGPTGSKPALYEEIKQISLPHKDYGSVSEVSGLLYFPVDTGAGISDTIISFDPETREEQVIYKAPEQIQWFQANAEWIVWETKSGLMARPLGGGKIQTIDSGQSLYSARLVDDRVAWMSRTEAGECKIVLHDLAEGQTIKVADVELPGFYNAFVDLSSDRLLWTDIRDGQGYYRVADLGGAQSQGLPIEDFKMDDVRFRYPGYSELAGDKFYSINFDNYQEWTWDIQQFGYYSTAQRKFIPVIDDRSINFFSVSGSRVAVIDTRQHLLLYDAADPKRYVDLTEKLGVTFELLYSADDDTFVAVEFRPLEQTEGFTFHIINVK